MNTRLHALLHDPDLMDEVKQRIESEHLSLQQAAEQIGTTTPTLRRHLRGGIPRSDSAMRYAMWLLDLKAEPVCHPVPNLADKADRPALCLPYRPRSRTERRPQVVDLFCGCGGLSLGFEAAGYDTALACDLDDEALSVYEDNLGHVSTVCMDLSVPLHPAEILALTLLGLARRHGAGLPVWRQVIRDSPTIAHVLEIAHTIARLDSWMRDHAAIQYDGHADAIASLPHGTLSQSLVRGLLDDLYLPRPTRAGPQMPSLPWSTDDSVDSDLVPSSVGSSAYLPVWTDAVQRLEQAGQAVGRVAGRKIEAFLDLLYALDSSGLQAAWARWLGARQRARERISALQDDLQHLLDGMGGIDLLAGGPPCQGFSRAGRGKLRSLRDSSLSAHHDEVHTDRRNSLYEVYVHWLDVLKPRALLFENVEHFSSSTSDGFSGHDALMKRLQDGPYDVTHALIDAADHGLPQHRRRHFVAGVRHGSADGLLDLIGVAKTVSVDAALSGLPDAALPPSDKRYVEAQPPSGRSMYFHWMHKMVGWIGRSTRPPMSYAVDSHCARLPRSDDQALFRRLGPGCSWLDYRADEGSPTLQALRAVVGAAMESDLDVEGIDLSELLRMLDGSMPLRCLLESMSDLPHHLLADSYLSRRPSAHGDWLRRLPMGRPSPTITAHLTKDGYAFVHPSAPRTLSVREAARLQSFPDSFRLSSVSTVAAFRLIGNAVPPLLANQLADELYSACRRGPRHARS